MSEARTHLPLVLCPARVARLRASTAAWPALALYLGMWPAALAGEWTAVWQFFFSGTVLAVALSRARYVRDRARALDIRPTPGSSRQPASARGADQ